MESKVPKLLEDIYNSICQIEEFMINKRTFELFNQDKMLQNAIERQLIIIGEAVNQISKMDNTIHLSYNQQIIALRNRLVHAYDSIDETIIYNLIINHLPKLKEEVNSYF
jgi:uncharacterized protein with HEPN domain